MPRKKAGTVYRCREGFSTPDGINVSPGDLASPDHPIVKASKELFDEVQEQDYVRFYVAPKKEERVVEATKEPGKKRGEK